jgi:hypothetical protein
MGWWDMMSLVRLPFASPECDGQYCPLRVIERRRDADYLLTDADSLSRLLPETDRLT